MLTFYQSWNTTNDCKLNMTLHWGYCCLSHSAFAQYSCLGFPTNCLVWVMKRLKFLLSSIYFFFLIAIWSMYINIRTFNIIMMPQQRCDFRNGYHLIGITFSLLLICYFLIFADYINYWHRFLFLTFLMSLHFFKIWLSQ